MFLRIVEMVLDTKFGVGTVNGLRTNEEDSDRNLAAPRPPVGDGWLSVWLDTHSRCLW